jgi:multidrug efflux pump subunit AcrB
MNIHLLDNLTAVLQTSISPVALISGVGLLVLSLTNRLGRVMDRLRDLLDQRREASTPDAQITVLHRRAALLRGSVTAAVTCILLASTLVLVLFSMAIFGGRLELLVIALFAFSILALIVSLVLFIFDLNQSLRAVEEELAR